MTHDHHKSTIRFNEPHDWNRVMSKHDIDKKTRCASTLLDPPTNPWEYKRSFWFWILDSGKGSQPLTEEKRPGMQLKHQQRTKLNHHQYEPITCEKRVKPKMQKKQISHFSNHGTSLATDNLRRIHMMWPNWDSGCYDASHHLVPSSSSSPSS